MKRFHWRPLRLDDLDALMTVMVAAFPAHYEERACFEERLLMSPSWCFALEDEASSLQGYFVAYPWPLYSIPILNTLLLSLPEQSQALFINDLAVNPEAAGTGQAAAIVEQVAGCALDAGLEWIALVAVNNSMGFWRRNGFASVACDPVLSAKLTSYGEGARYMVRTLKERSLNRRRPPPEST